MLSQFWKTIRRTPQFLQLSSRIKSQITNQITIQSRKNKIETDGMDQKKETKILETSKDDGEKSHDSEETGQDFGSTQATQQATMVMMQQQQQQQRFNHPPIEYTSIARNLSRQAQYQQVQQTHVQGQEPLTSKILAKFAPQEQKQMLGERLFPFAQRFCGNMAGKITGMLLEMDNDELLVMLDCTELLKSKIDEALAVLHAHQKWDQADGQ